jgi:Dullard-like phosphatase family protein
MSNYNRNYPKEKEQTKVLSNPDILFGLTHKDSFNINVDNPKSRLTGDKANSLSKNKNTIIHSNSTNHMRPDNIIPSLEKNYNIININVNNLIINNNNNNQMKNNNNNNNNNIHLFKEKKFKNNNNIDNDLNHSKVFSKAGNVIIGKANNPLSVNKKNKYLKNHYLNLNNNNYRSSSQKPIPKLKEKYNNINPPTSDIQGVINDLMEASKKATPNIIKIDKNNNNNNNNEKININVINKDSDIESQIISDEKIIGLHVKLWEGFFNMELQVDNKNGISNQLKKLLVLVEKEFVEKNKSKIFKNIQLNKVYSKILKIYFVLITYIKFLLVDFSYEMTIKSNVKRLLSSISNHLLLLLVSYASNENIIFSKANKDFSEIFGKMVKMKKIKKSKDTFSLFCSNMNKNLELSIYIIKQFSNNFFKIGYFKPIHTILFDIFLSIDTYAVEDVANIIINGVLFYLLHKNPNDKKEPNIPSIISFGTGISNTLAALGFIEVPAPYLPKLPENIEKSTYTLVLDLDETLVHFFFTPSGGTFLIRPFCFKFLEDMSKIFEIAIFTAATKDYADSILDIIDPNKKLINYRLYRHHTSICDITFVKDLTKIGRNLNRCLIIDNLADNFKLQPNNGIQCGTWIDDMKDTQLNDIDIILTQIIERKPQDIKPIIKRLNDEINKKMKGNTNLNPFKDIDVTKLFK